MESTAYKILVKTDDVGRVTAINSNAFVSGDGWTQIDEGEGDRYHHAQNNYLPKPLTDERGVYNYKMAEGKVVERSTEEMDADYASRPAPKPTEEERIKTLENQNETLLQCILEMSEIVYA